MDSQQLDPKVVERIRKTLNLARNGGATEAEAEAAAEMAQKLMRKYNITMAEVDAAGSPGHEGSRRTKQAQKGRAAYLFQQQLMVACAEVNFCVVLKVTEYKRGRPYVTGYQLIGREANVIATQALFDYLMTTTERLAFEYVGCDNTQRLSRTATSFKEGCAGRIEDRLRERHQQALAEQAEEARKSNSQAPSSGVALAVVLQDVARDEADRNTDFRLGLAEGTTAHRRLEGNRNWRLYCAVAKALREAPTTDRELLTQLARSTALGLCSGLGVPTEPALAQARLACSVRLGELDSEAKERAETPAQKRKREEAECKAQERAWARAERESDREYARRDHTAHRAGSAAGGRVGLDTQVGEGTPSRKTRMITRVINGGRTELTGPAHMVNPPRPIDVQEALARMRKAQHVNRHVLEVDGVDSLVELLYLENAHGETWHSFLKRNGCHVAYIPAALR